MLEREMRGKDFCRKTDDGFSRFVKELKERHMPEEFKKTAFVFAGGGSLGSIQVGMLQALAANGVAEDARPAPAAASAERRETVILSILCFFGRCDAATRRFARKKVALRLH